jgi:hypothetical protein
MDVRGLDTPVGVTHPVEDGVVCATPLTKKVFVDDPTRL